MEAFWLILSKGDGAKGIGIGWVVTTAKETKLKERIWSGYGVHKYPQSASIPLQGLNSHLGDNGRIIRSP